MSSNRKEWKKVRNRRAKTWKALNRPYTPISVGVKISLLAVVMVLIVLVPMYAYWSNNIGSGSPCNIGWGLNSQGKCSFIGPDGKADPWSTLWNGQTSGSTAAITPGAGTMTGLCNGACASSSIGPMKTGDFILVHTFCEAGNGVTGITDSVSNTYTNVVSAVRGVVWYTKSIADGSGGGNTVSVTVTFDCLLAGNPAGAFSVEIIKGATFIGATSHNENSCNPCGSVTTTDTLITTGQKSMIYEAADAYDSGGVCPTPFTLLSGQTKLNTLACLTQSGGANGGEVENVLPPLNPATYTLSITDSHSGSGLRDLVLLDVEIGNSFAGPLCGTYYDCQNANLQNGDITTTANSTFPGLALSHASVDLSTGVAKTLGFSFSGNASFIYNNEQLGWFLTTNATLPNTQSWSPLHDANVALAVVGIVASNHLTVNWYVYIQRARGQMLNVTFNDDPLTNIGCNQASVLFICYHSTAHANNQPFLMALALNETGPNNAGAGAGGISYFCTDYGGGSKTCNVGGVNGVQAAWTNTIISQNFTLPWLNIQTQYHVGFWQAADPSMSGQSVSFQTDNRNPFNNAISVFTPVSTPNDSGGFFGWLGRTVGGAVNTVFKSVQNVATWAQNTALGPIGDVLQGLISWLINQLVNFINWIGGVFLGNSSLGTQLLTSFNNIIGIVTKVLIDFVTWFVNFGSFVQAAITLGINIFANTVVFGILGFFANSLTTLVSIVLTVITTFFSYATPTSYLLMMDWVWAIMMVYVIGVSGFLWWVDLNVQAFTFVFKMMWKFIEAVWSTIIIIKSFIPTEGGTSSNVNNPIPTSGGRGGAGSQSGSQGKPAPSKPSEGAKARQEKREEKAEKQSPKAPKVPRGIGQGAKDGDPMAIVVMAFLIIVLLYWLSQAAFSPVATVQTAGCWAWSTNCHLQNGIMVGSLDTTVFFAFMFSTSHGIFTLFTLAIPLIVIMFARWFQNNVIGGDDDDGEEEGNMFFNW